MLGLYILYLLFNYFDIKAMLIDKSTDARLKD